MARLANPWSNLTVCFFCQKKEEEEEQAESSTFKGVKLVEMHFRRYVATIKPNGGSAGINLKWVNSYANQQTSSLFN